MRRRAAGAGDSPPRAALPRWVNAALHTWQQVFPRIYPAYTVPQDDRALTALLAVLSALWGLWGALLHPAIPGCCPCA